MGIGEDRFMAEGNFPSQACTCSLLVGPPTWGTWGNLSLTPQPLSGTIPLAENWGCRERGLHVFAGKSRMFLAKSAENRSHAELLMPAI